MITDAFINFIASIIKFIIDLLPTAPIIAVGNGAASGSACCFSLMAQAITDALSATVVISGTTQQIFTGVTNGPLAVLLDWQLLGFFVGCAMAILVAFLVIKILLTFWMVAKP